MIVHQSAWTAFSNARRQRISNVPYPGKPPPLIRPRPGTVTVITFADICEVADHPPGVSVPGGSQYYGIAVAAAGIGVAGRRGPVLA